MHVKKATKPLDPNLRAGGYLVLPVAQVHAKVWYNYSPRSLVLGNLLNDSLAAWASNAYYELGCLEEPRIRHEDRLKDFTYEKIGLRGSSVPTPEADRPRQTFLTPEHFAQRLTPSEAQRIIDRVIQNAERINTEERFFYYDWIGIFGSILRGSETPGDVDIVYAARWSDSDLPLPESSYYPFSRNEPTDLASRALRTGCRRTAVSPHYHQEVECLGTPYQILWTKDKGRVKRKTTFQKAKRKQEDDSQRDLAREDAFADDFRTRCATLAPLPAPEVVSIPPGTKALSYAEWKNVLNSNDLVISHAHTICLPPGKLKEKLSQLGKAISIKIRKTGKKPKNSSIPI
jgi:hypothetical protein